MLRTAPGVARMTEAAGNGGRAEGVLARIGQRCQQPPLPSGMSDSQMLPAPIELVKLQLQGARWSRHTGEQNRCSGESTDAFSLSPARG